MKRIFLAVLMLLIVALMTLSVGAEEWYLEDGDIQIYVAAADHPRVTQGDRIAVDPGLVITQRDPKVPTDHTISTKGEQYAYFTLTLKDVNMECVDKNPITVEVATNFQLVGENTIRAHGKYSCVRPYQHAASFFSDQGGVLRAYAEQGAALGTNAGEAMQALTYVNAAGKVYCYSETGAGIGTGEGGDLKLEINISGNADVHAFSQSGAGIGTGKGGNFVVAGLTMWGGHVEAVSESGAGFGTGEDGSMLGTPGGGPASYLHVYEGAVLTAASQSGAGVGTGKNGEISGSVIVVEGSLEAKSVSGAGLGTGENGSLAKMNDLGFGYAETNSRIIVSSQSGAGLGTGKGGDMNCWNFMVDGHVEAASVSGAAIGTGENGTLTDCLTFKPTAVVDARSESGAGIGTGRNGKAALADPRFFYAIWLESTTNARSVSGAGIGTGAGGELVSGTEVAVNGIAGPVYASSQSGAGIGTGKGGVLYGGVGVTGQVEAVSVSGAGIGSGEGANLEHQDTGSHGGVVSASFNMDYPGLEQYVTASSQSGAGIGTGKGGSVINGFVSVGVSATVSSVTGAGVGTGEEGDFVMSLPESGSISLFSDSADVLVTVSSDSGAAVGTGKGGQFSGTAGVSTGLIATSRSGAGIGTGEGGDMNLEQDAERVQSGISLNSVVLDWYSMDPDAPMPEVSIISQTGAAIGTGENGNMNGFLGIYRKCTAVSAEGMQYGAGKGGTVAEELDFGPMCPPRIYDVTKRGYSYASIDCDCGNTVMWMFTTEELNGGSVTCDQCGTVFEF